MTGSLTYNEGYLAVQGHLLSEYGLRVSYPRVRRAVTLVDPDSVHWRRHRMRVRRVYNCLCPLEMFHADANCKLVKYKIYFHGCIDGKTHLIIYVTAAGYSTCPK